MIQNSRTWWVFRCECKHPTMRPNGKKISKGCLKWGVKSSKYSDFENKDIQADCKECKRKGRLTPSTTNLFKFETKANAVAFASQMNLQQKEGEQ